MAIEPAARTTTVSADAEKLGVALIRAALKQEEDLYPALLATKLEIPKQWLSQYLNGGRRMTFRVWLSIWEFAKKGSREEAAYEWLKYHEGIDIRRDDWKALLPEKDLSTDGRRIRGNIAKARKKGPPEGSPSAQEGAAPGEPHRQEEASATTAADQPAPPPETPAVAGESPIEEKPLVDGRAARHKTKSSGQMKTPHPTDADPLDFVL